MTELRIPEVILRERRKKHLTQEELAAQLGVSSQAISNWERGGYPDITLLPRIANFFGITVDELIGNDEVNRKEDIQVFRDQFWSIPGDKQGFAKRLTLAKEYYQKYPGDYAIMHDLGYAIVNNMDTIADHAELMKEIHEKIMAGCNDEGYRRDSIHYMCYACTDEELEDRIGNSELDWSEAVAIGEIREDRYLLQNRIPEYYSQRNSNDLMIFMQYLGRNNMNYYRTEDAFVFDEPKRTAAWELHKLRLLEAFSDGGEIPEAWSGCYAECTLKAAGALIGCGKIDEGFDMLEKAFPRYERWLKIPAGALMDVGCHDVFGGAKITKWDSEKCTVEIYFEDGRNVWTPYLWLFWQLRGDIFAAMSQWRWFDSVKEDQRFGELYEKARELAGK
ncbi:MAG: helix-turn-helix transcriptional regulator [Ruminococcaceae bacterium]|nr:helix-turn-helix transcriptional regulator [Oscillospiraceae bacterium]